ncbi:MAG: ABC transporter permease subunit [Gemmatimonadetes bacterium]|nr:ABC transporter permease subunit [Gemmatimonadota bacterium]
MARKIVLGLFVVATVVWGTLALALQIDVVDGTLQGIRLFGQAPEVQVEGNGEPAEQPFGGEDPLRMIVIAAESVVAGAAYWIGILLALFATGGLVASMMDRGQVDLLLSKPLGRSTVLGGRLLGVGIVVALLAFYLMGMVWLVMSLKTGVWNPRFLLAIGVVLAMFAVVYSVVTLVSVSSGSAPLALVVTLGLLFVSLVVALPGLPDKLQEPWRQVVQALHAVLPRFADVGGRTVPSLARGVPVRSWTHLVASLGFGLVAYAAAFAVFRRKDF